MGIVQLILIVLLIWVIATFLVPILTFPRMPIINFNILTKLPKELKDEIKKLNKIKDDKKFVVRALNYLKKNFQTNSLLLFVRLHKHYYKEAHAILKRKGFFPCHIQVFILRLLLIKSKRFKQEDVKVHYTFYSGIIHEYLKVKVKNKWINVDPWGYNKGVPFGKHTMGPIVDWFRFKLSSNKSS